MLKKKRAQILLVVFGALLLLVSVTANAQAQRFGGEWDTVTSTGRQIHLTLSGRSTSVSGNFLPPNGLTSSNRTFDGVDQGFVKVSAFRAEPVMQTAGSLTGTVDGDVLRFTWRQDNAAGAGRFTLSSDGESFQGTFSRTNNPDDTSGGTWNGTRRHSFAGVWQGKLGEGFLETIIQQSGDRVTGQLKVNSAEFGMIKEAVVVGRTLKFVLVRMVFSGAGAREEYVGTGEFVLGANARSFSGTIMGAAASGNLIAR
jgi:hypothetical protein